MAKKIEPYAYTPEKDEKDLAVEELKRQGFDAWIKDGVVLCYADDDKTYDEMEKALKRIGYRFSFGTTRRQDG